MTPDGLTILHTAPHHDDIMLSYHPIAVALLANNQNHIAYATSGFNAVTNAYIQDSIDAGEHDEAERLLFGYLQPFTKSVECLKGTPNPDHAIVLKNHEFFLAVMSEILFERKNNIIPKQATIFSTNYDLFVEKASESFLGSLKLNDGFIRNPSLEIF